MNTNTIENFAGSDIIDVRDIIARVEELREEREVLLYDVENEDDKEKAIATLKDWNTDNGSELQTLENLLSDLCDNGCDEQWEGNWYPVTLIREGYFEESMDEMIADCYPDLSNALPCFVTVTLDYEMLKQDYTECEFEGEIYYYR